MLLLPRHPQVNGAWVATEVCGLGRKVAAEDKPLGVREQMVREWWAHCVREPSRQVVEAAAHKIHVRPSTAIRELDVIFARCLRCQPAWSSPVANALRPVRKNVPLVDAWNAARIKRVPGL